MGPALGFLYAKTAAEKHNATLLNQQGGAFARIQQATETLASYARYKGEADSGYREMTAYVSTMKEKIDSVAKQLGVTPGVAGGGSPVPESKTPVDRGTATYFRQWWERLDEAELRAQLTLAGYQHVTQVVSPGEYAVRGGLIDLYPMGATMPFRVDLWDQEIDSIRTFDPDSQRSLYPVPEVRLLPGREFPMDDGAQHKFRQRWRELLEGDPTRSRIYKDMGQGVASAGIECP